MKNIELSTYTNNFQKQITQKLFIGTFQDIAWYIAHDDKNYFVYDIFSWYYVDQIHEKNTKIWISYSFGVFEVFVKII